MPVPRPAMKKPTVAKKPGIVAKIKEVAKNPTAQKIAIGVGAGLAGVAVGAGLAKMQKQGKKTRSLQSKLKQTMLKIHLMKAKRKLRQETRKELRAMLI